MFKDENNILHSIATKAEWSNGLVTNVQLDEPSDSKSSFKYFIAKNAFKENVLNGNTDIDAIYFNDIAPVIYIKTLKEYNPEEVIKLHNRFWNEGRTPLTLIITPKTIKILDNYSKPVTNSNNINSIELKEFSTAKEDLENLASILHQSKLDSEKVVGESLIVKTEQRVDKKLIEQLRYAREILYKDFGLDFGLIHDLLGRSLFTLYLEHKNILTKEDIKLETGIEKDFFELLNNHPSETYKLFKFLKEKFNGDLFPISEKEEDTIKNNPGILSIIYDCYTGEKDLKKGQYSLFRLFNFKHIPIELISAIYEEFMSEEDTLKNKIIDNKEKTKKELGAFYTPQMLVEFVYNEILPMPSIEDHNYNIKILDPACGSGIFLVEGYKRLIERWKFTHKTETLNKEILLKILKDNIYGIELHPEAIKITAFSLYLTFLQYINPRDILRKVSFETLIYWTKNNENIEFEDKEIKKFGNNLLRGNTFIREDLNYESIKEIDAFFNTKFDLIVGNPPWKRSNVDLSIINWAKKNGWEVKKDIVKAFLAYASYISPNATIALISSAKVLFNTSGTDDDFRIHFFKKNRVNVIVNFAIVRDVLFENANQASALIIYTKRQTNEININENIIYVVPKVRASIRNRKTITIDASEIKTLPLNEVLKVNSKIFKIGMYGGMRDLKFINRLNLMKSIDDFETEKKVSQGMGLIKDKDAKFKGNTRLKDNYFIEVDNIMPYYTPTPKEKLEQHKDFLLHRTDKRNLYSAPLVLFKEGTKLGELCCSYVGYDCAFLSASKAIKFINQDEVFHKAMVACLNSSLATYYYIMISSSIGLDRNRVQKNEVSLFPVIADYLKKEDVILLSNKVDLIIKIYKSNKFEDLLIREKIKPIKDDIDTILYKALKISENELILINNVINFSNVLKENYKKIGAETPLTLNCQKEYSQTFLNTINDNFKNSTINLKAEIYKNINFKEELAVVKFYFEKNISNKNLIEEVEIDISKILQEINDFSFHNNKSSIYYRRFLKYEFQNGFYLIKPNQKRFWNRAIALNDADDLIVEILNQGIY